MKTKINKRDHVNSLVRGLEIMRTFTRTRPSMTLNDISRASDLVHVLFGRVASQGRGQGLCALIQETL